MIDKNMKVNLKEILDKEFPDERYSEKCYLCDPDKNVLCPKEVCHINGGPCWNTTNKEFEKKKTNQDKLAEKLRNMNPKDLAGFIVDCTALGECPNCPALNYCERYYCTDGDDLHRVPDENGEILECKDIFERWLKEEYSE